MKTFAIGDIHGRIEALKEVLHNSKFDYQKDKLIILGDICDGGYNTYEVIEELLKIKNKILILGNHDCWFMNNISSGWAEEIWTSQGGNNTIQSYKNKPVPITHQEFLNSGKFYHVEKGMIFVHGGYKPKIPLEENTQETLTWDRELINLARFQPIHATYQNKKFIPKKVFIGHTTTQTYGKTEPIKFNNLIMIDCGAGWNGKLCLMNIKTEQTWLSQTQTPGGRNESL